MCPDHRGVSNLVPTPAGPTGDYISNNNTRSDTRQHTHTQGNTHTHSVLVLCTYKCFEGDQSADKMSSSLTSGGHYRKEANTLDRYAGILFFSLRGLRIPGG